MNSKEKCTYQLEDGVTVTPNRLAKLGKEKQISAMRYWFGEHFSDPNILPYDSSEGGFQWIWGGPYEARDELESEFGGLVKQAALDELAKELERENWQWSGNPDEYEPDDDDFYDFSLTLLTPSAFLQVSLNQIEEASKLKSLGENQQFIQRLLFANAVTALETYLADTFRKGIEGNPARIQKFVETFSGIRDVRIPISAASETARNLEKLVMDKLSKVIWHHLDKISEMYANTFSVTFPDDLSHLEKSVKDRHDIVHRNGKSVDGTIGCWDEK